MQLNLNNIIDVHKKISNNVKWTETSFSNSISEKLGVDIFFKFENRNYHIQNSTPKDKSRFLQ